MGPDSFCIGVKLWTLVAPAVLTLAASTGGCVAVRGRAAAAVAETASGSPGPGAWQYTNPVIRGDWSDPGVVRVGEDYYSVRSTFGWQPGLAVAHSKDLVHWEYIGNGFTYMPAIGPGEVANGIWGSEIIFNPNTSMFM